MIEFFSSQLVELLVDLEDSLILLNDFCLKFFHFLLQSFDDIFSLILVTLHLFWLIGLDSNWFRFLCKNIGKDTEFLIDSRYFSE